MKERPILFNGEMVRAILDGRKTQTRRAVKPQPPEGHQWHGWIIESSCRKDEGKATWAAGPWPRLNDPHRVRCPYGQPGDRLWVRETWRTGWSYGGDYPTVQYRATETAHVGGAEYPVLDVLRGEFGITDTTPHAIVPGGKWKPSIHMPRWASRITLEISSVRVERLQEISEADARAEGISDGGCMNCGNSEPCGCAQPEPSARESFAWLWQSINGPGSWSGNPWVWVVEFKLVEASNA